MNENQGYVRELEWSNALLKSRYNRMTLLTVFLGASLVVTWSGIILYIGYVL